MDGVKRTISTNIGKLLDEKGLSQRDAEKVIPGIKRTALSNLSREDSRGISNKHLIAIADYFGVSTDWILGRTNNRMSHIDIGAAADLIGLSSDSIARLHSYIWQDPDDGKTYSSIAPCCKALDALIADFGTPYETAAQYSADPKSILTLIWEFLTFDGIEQPYKYSDGKIIDDNPVTTKPGDIKLNDRIIENAILMEIQRALFRVKDNLKAGEMDGKHQ